MQIARIATFLLHPGSGNRGIDVSAAKQMTFTGTRENLRERLTQLEARGATGIIFGTSGYDVERELRAYAEVAGLR
jgi:hypothetical protein